MKKFFAGIVAGIVLGITLCVAERQHRWTDMYVLHNHVGYTVINYDSVVYNDGCRVCKNWHLKYLKP